jgi:pyruvate formate lyase activating enzyme
MASQIELRLSLPLIPGISDSKENIEQTAEFARSIGVVYIDILPFHRLGHGKYQSLGLKSPFSSYKNVPDRAVQEVVASLEAKGLKVTRGRLI